MSQYPTLDRITLSIRSATSQIRILPDFTTLANSTDTKSTVGFDLFLWIVRYKGWAISVALDATRTPPVIIMESHFDLGDYQDYEFLDEHLDGEAPIEVIPHYSVTTLPQFQLVLNKLSSQTDRIALSNFILSVQKLFEESTEALQEIIAWYFPFPWGDTSNEPLQKVCSTDMKVLFREITQVNEKLDQDLEILKRKYPEPWNDLTSDNYVLHTEKLLKERHAVKANHTCRVKGFLHKCPTLSRQNVEKLEDDLDMLDLRFDEIYEKLDEAFQKLVEDLIRESNITRSIALEALAAVYEPPTNNS